MIVSENGAFLNMELPKRGTSMASMVTRVAPQDLIVNKKVQYQSRMKDDGILLPPTDFKAWRGKLDKLKQVVRRTTNPSEIQIHQSKFMMTKRSRAATLNSQIDGSKTMTQIQSQCFNLEESILSGEPKDGEMTPADVLLQSTQQLNPESGEDSQEYDEELTSSGVGQSQIRQAMVMNSVPELKTEETTVRQSEMDEGRGEMKQQSYLVSEESCLGYMYPKKIDDSVLSQTAIYGSKLGEYGIDQDGRNRQNKNVPKGSNLKSLMTYPKTIKSKNGAVIGYTSVDKLPMSLYLELLERQRKELKTASIIHSPTLRKSKMGGRQSQLSGDRLSQGSSLIGELRNQMKDLEAQEHAIADDFTPKNLNDHSALRGWEADQQAGRASISSHVLTTRVGGVTFVKNTQPKDSNKESLNVTQDSKFNLSRHSKSGQNISQPMIRRRKQQKHGIMGYERNNYQRFSSGDPFSKHKMVTQQTPLQLGNIGLLMANLEKTGNLQQANEEAYKRNQKTKYATSLKQLSKKTAIAIAADSRGVDTSKQPNTFGSGHSSQNLNDTLQSVYMTDDLGNLMKVSKSNIFESNFDNYHKMVSNYQTNTNSLLASNAAQLEQNNVQQQPTGKQNRKTRQLVSPATSKLSMLNSQGRDSMTNMNLHQNMPFRYKLNGQNSTHYITQLPSNNDASSNKALVYKTDTMAITKQSDKHQNTFKVGINHPNMLVQSAYPIQQIMTNGIEVSPRNQYYNKDLVNSTLQPSHMDPNSPQNQIIHASSQSSNRLMQPTFGGGSSQTITKQAQGGGVVIGHGNSTSHLNGSVSSKPQQRLSGSSMIMVQGGSAILQTKDAKKAINAGDASKQSNVDLHMLDPTLTLKSSAKQIGLMSVQNQQQFVVAANLNAAFTNEAYQSFNESVNKIDQQISGVTSLMTDIDQVQKQQQQVVQQQQWQVANQQNIVLDYHQNTKVGGGAISGSPNSFQLSQDISSPRRAKQSRQSRHSNNTHVQMANEPSEANNLPTMLQNMKNRMNSQAAQRKNNAQKSTTDYEIIGRSVSPGVNQQQQAAAAALAQASIGSNQGPLSSRRSTSKDSIQNNTKATPQNQIAHHQKRSMTVKNGGVMRFEQTEIVQTEVLTMIGDTQVDMLELRLGTGQSRGGMRAQGDTVRLENISSKDKVLSDVGSNHSDKHTPYVDGNFQPNSVAISSYDATQNLKPIKSPKAVLSHRTEDIYRQPIAIERPQEQGEVATPQASHISVGNEDPSVKMKSVAVENHEVYGDQTRNTDNLLQNNNQQQQLQSEENSQLINPKDVFIVHENSQGDMLALQEQMTQLKGVQNMKVNLESKQKKEVQTDLPDFIQQSHLDDNLGRSTAFAAKRSTKDSVQKYLEHKGTMQKMKFNSTISSVNIGTMEQTQFSTQKYGQTSNVMNGKAQKRGFLPTMPFKHSNFAQTQKAIKQMRQPQPKTRQGGDRRKEQDQFLHLNEYKLAQNQDMRGISYQQNYSTALNSDINKKGTAFNVTKTTSMGEDIAIDSQNFVTTTSFGPMRNRTGTNNQEPATANLVYGSPQSKDSTYKQSSIEKDLVNSQFKTDLALTNDKSGASFYEPDTPGTQNVVIVQTNELHRHPYNLAGQGTALLSDYPFQQQSSRRGEEQTLGMDSKSKMNSVEFNETSQGNFNPANGSIIIKKRETPQVKQIEVRKNSMQSGGRSPLQKRVNKLGSPNSPGLAQTALGCTQSKASRQVVVHKLTMQAPNIASDKNFNSSNRKQSQFVLANIKSSPRIAYEQEQHTNKEFSATEQSTHVQSGHFESSLRVARFQGSQKRSNIINLGVMTMPHGSQVQEEANTPLLKSTRGILMASNTGKLVTENEAKARQFIEKQRKRTATLGAQRHKRHMYRVGQPLIGFNVQNRSNSPTNKVAATENTDQSSPGLKALPDQNNDISTTTNKKNVPQQTAPIIDFNGKNLYDSGLFIKQATVISTSQPKYIQNRKIIQQQQQEQFDNKVSTSKGNIGDSYRDNIMPDTTTKVPPTVAVNLNQRNVALSRMNHPVVNSNPRPANQMETRGSPRKGQSPRAPTISTSPKILAPNPAGPTSPTQKNDQNRHLQQITSKVASVIESTDYVSSLHQQSNVAEHQQQVLIITSSANINIQPTITSGNNRKQVQSSSFDHTQQQQQQQQDVDAGSSKYGDYLRGTTEYGDNFSVRAKTPMPEASTGKMLVQQQSKQQPNDKL